MLNRIVGMCVTELGSLVNRDFAEPSDVGQLDNSGMI